MHRTNAVSMKSDNSSSTATHAAEAATAMCDDVHSLAHAVSAREVGLLPPIGAPRRTRLRSRSRTRHTRASWRGARPLSRHGGRRWRSSARRRRGLPPSARARGPWRRPRYRRPRGRRCPRRRRRGPPYGARGRP
jgi:hypothetical protein